MALSNLSPLRSSLLINSSVSTCRTSVLLTSATSYKVSPPCLRYEFSRFIWQQSRCPRDLGGRCNSRIQSPKQTIKRDVSTASPAATGSAPSIPSQTSSRSSSQLTWNEFLQLRRVRRYFNLGASIGTSFASLLGGLAVMSQQNLVALSQQMFGLDPFVLLGLSAAGFGVVGWLLGPIVGTGVFRVFYSSKAAGMPAKEKDFFERIKKYRVDPSNSSMSNPTPDYYGEKITSVAGYRRWLKDQRAFNKKRHSYV